WRRRGAKLRSVLARRSLRLALCRDPECRDLVVRRGSSVARGDRMDREAQSRRVYPSRSRRCAGAAQVTVDQLTARSFPIPYTLERASVVHVVPHVEDPNTRVRPKSARLFPLGLTQARQAMVAKGLVVAQRSPPRIIASGFAV